MNEHNFKGEKVDVIILDHATVNEKLYKKLKKMNLFNEVFFAKTRHVANGGKSKIEFLRDLKELNHFRKKEYMLNQVNLKQVNYEKVLVPSDDPPSQVFWYHIKQNHPEASLYVYEDGTKSYTFFDLKFSKFKSWYLNHLFGVGFFEEIEGAFLHHPKYFANHRNVATYTIPPIDKKDPKVKEVMNDVFDFQESDGLFKEQTHFVFFDQAFQFDSELLAQQHLYQLLNEQIDSKRMVVKMHPRTERHEYQQTIAGNYPFEVMQLNNQMRNKVLISAVSTACLSPKLVFDEEPYVILFYKLMDAPIFQQSQKAYFDFAERVQADYRDKNRFFIPETEEELKQIVERLSSELACSEKSVYQADSKSYGGHVDTDAYLNVGIQFSDEE
jgi:hypothetical protein